jgi:hypothetical protein
MISSGFVGMVIVPFSTDVIIWLFATVTCRLVHGSRFSSRWADDWRRKISVHLESAVS